MPDEPEKLPPDPIENLAAQSGGPETEALDRLSEIDRIQIEARMLPQDKPITDEMIDEIRGRAKTYMARTGATGLQIAKECGYVRSVITEWLGGKYPGKSDEVARKVNEWMERDGRRRVAARPKDFVPTRVADYIRATVAQADKHCMIAVIVVPAGAGKTKVLKILTEQMNGLYLYCNQQLTPREFLRSLCDALGRREKTGTKAEMERWIVAKLKGTKRIIFLDEAHQLGAALNCVRSIHDQAEVPIVLAGTSDILQQVNDRADGRGQFSSRCIFYNAIETAMNVEDPNGGKAGGKDLFSVEEIKAFFAMKKMRLADDAIQLCWALACLPNHGTLRLIEKTTSIVMDMEPELAVITRRHVLVALRMMVGEQVNYLQRVASRHAEMSQAA